LLALIDNAEEDVRRSVENRNKRRQEREQTS
ncbi:FadR family transcriptional regulator, partial [Mesorhizobium sp. M7A.F.Ca.CA.002.15.2.1]